MNFIGLSLPQQNVDRRNWLLVGGLFYLNDFDQFKQTCLRSLTIMSKIFFLINFLNHAYMKNIAAATVAKKNQLRSFSVLTTHAQLMCVSRVVEKIVDFLVILHLSPHHIWHVQSNNVVFSILFNIVVISFENVVFIKFYFF